MGSGRIPEMSFIGLSVRCVRDTAAGPRPRVVVRAGYRCCAECIPMLPSRFW